MQQPRLHWTGYSHESSHVLLFKAEETIRPFGFITDIQPYSDLALSLKIEVQGERIQPLYQALSAIMKIDTDENEQQQAEGETAIMLNIRFSSGSGNKRYEVPVVPG